MPSIGPMELVIVLVVALLVLGPKRLPDAGRSLGRSLREFKEAISPGRDGRSELPERTALSGAPSVRRRRGPGAEADEPDRRREVRAVVAERVGAGARQRGRRLAAVREPVVEGEHEPVRRLVGDRHDARHERARAKRQQRAAAAP